MKQKHLVLVLFALLIASFTTSVHSYQSTERWVMDDINQALTQTLAEQRSNVIDQDTIRAFNSHLQVAELRGKATITVDTRQKKNLSCQAQCSMATIFSLSDQRPATVLWSLTLLWAMFCLYQRRFRMGIPVTTEAQGNSLQLVEGQFVSAQGKLLPLTPMQQQLMELFWQAPNHKLTKQQIYDALWPKKPDASDTLYTLIRRLRPVIEANTSLEIETDRGRSYTLKEKRAES